MILAGGLGTRLRAAVPDLPKVLAPVRGQPFISYLIRQLGAQGCRRVVLAVGYLRDRVVGALGASLGGVALDYSEEASPLGTGGAIWQAAARTTGRPLVVLNGDTWVGIDYPALLASHRAHGAALSVAAVEVPDVARFGALRIADGVITGFLEKGTAGPGWINAGCYVIDDRVLALRRAGEAFSFERDVLEAHLDRLSPRVFRASGPFIDIGVPDDYAMAQHVVPALR